MQKRLISGMFGKTFLPGVILALAVIAYIAFYGKLEPIFSGETIEHLDKWVFVIFTLMVTFLLQRIATAILDWYGSNIAEKTSTTLDDEFLPLARKLTVLLIWVIITLIILSRFGINTNGIIAALGVGSLAIALAAQDTISNIIAGFLIMVDRPFRLDDTIKLPSGEKVKVLTIGLRRSKFRAEDGAIIIVPNLALSKSKIVNYTYGKEDTTAKRS
jgi:small-conductance mechanosensitive channel